ncbi:MAG: endolytic transglycosylase MltG [Candidatus Eisenbacteria bacterium]|nr:endolytic transglycosylase MltG [Candidatus Latescibacterota bacterium]MBD3301764.1 endolytic transglycosylase MltG [Candidatus Eisenbacteria bacterium]
MGGRDQAAGGGPIDPGDADAGRRRGRRDPPPVVPRQSEDRLSGRFRRSASLLFFLALVAVAASAVGFLYLQAELDRPTERSREGPGILEVHPGSSFRSVVAALADSGWVRRPRMLALWARLTGVDRGIQVGLYRLPEDASPRELIERIAGGEVEQVRVTIPEGWREERILALLADSLQASPAAVRAAAADSAWIASLGIPSGRLEGFLFPETYLFPRTYPPREAIARMVEEFQRRFDEPMRKRAEALGLSVGEVVALASIVEAEATLEEEMPRIAGVFHRRLDLGWKLEADPTVLYALGRSAGPVLHRDLEVESDYNTYRVAGLPPGAIGNPGDAALAATLWPDSTRRDLYFVARGDGSHVFSRTLAEHNAARRRVRAMRRDGSR